MKRILLGYDGSEPAQVAAFMAGRLARQLDATVTLFVAGYLVTPVGTAVVPTVAGRVTLLYVYDTAAAAAATHPDAMVRLQRTMQQEGDAALARGYTLCEQAEVPCDAVEVRGRPADVICTLAESGTYQLVALGRRGRSGLARVALGSVSDEVLRRVRCPVLLAGEQAIPAPRAI